MLKTFIRYVSFNTMGMLALSLYIFADTFFIAQAVGPNGITALNFCLSVWGVMSGFGMMVGVGSATRFNILSSNGQKEEATQYFKTAITIGISSGLLLGMIAQLYSREISVFLGADADTLGFSTIYMKTFLSFAPFFIMNYILQAFVRNDHNPRLSMIAMLVGSISNVILDWLFMFPLGMGMFGAALATCLSPVISISILLVHVFSDKSHLKLGVLQVQWKRFKDIVSLGISTFVMEISGSIYIMAFNYIILILAGNHGVAAYGIVLNTSFLGYGIFNGVSQGVQPLISRAYATRQSGDLNKLKRYSVITALLISCVLNLISIIFHREIVSVFNKENLVSIQSLAERGLVIYFIGFFFSGVNTVAATVLNATVRIRESFFVTLLRGSVLLLPMMFLLQSIYKMDGVWLSYPITEAIILILCIYFLRRKHNDIDILEH